MTTKSMTGYGKGASELACQKLVVELKAVNHRFLDLNIKLPKGFTFAEDVIRKLIKDKIERGHIDVYVNYEDKRADKVAINIDYDLANSYLTAAKKLSDKFGVVNNFNTAEVLKMPEVVCQTINDVDENVLNNLVLDATLMAIQKLELMRTTEGELMKNDVLLKLDYVVQLVAKVSEFAPQMVIEHRTKVAERMAEMLGAVAVDESRLLNEIAFYTDKVCIDEEIARLQSHTVHFKEIFSNGGVVGKQLDFIVQEMNREANTMGSKCSNVQVTSSVLELKSTIEKIREQIQNIE